MIISYPKNRTQTTKVDLSCSKLPSIIYGVPQGSILNPLLIMKNMNNKLKVNAGKFHLFLSPYEDQTLTVENYVTKSSDVEELLGVTIDSNLNVKEHTLSLCKKANRKLHALSCVSKCMTFNKRRILTKSFIISQFNHCPLISSVIRNRESLAYSIRRIQLQF